MRTSDGNSIGGSLPASDCAIATWFVADDQHTSSYFPQIEARSDSFSAQAIYWRCIIAFFATSLAVNPDRRHILFTNTEVPVVDHRNINNILTGWGIEIIRLQITRRLPPNSVKSWGNQFYVFDVIQYWANTQGEQPLILLDSDCIWLRSATELVDALRQVGIVGYRLDAVDHSNINGISCSDMAHFLERHSEISRDAIPYYAGEFIAASGEMVRHIAQLEHHMWPAVLKQTYDAPREEAHLLSVIYATLGIKSNTGSQFIRRIWTTFRFNDVRDCDTDLMIWHLPAEKRTGFADLFRRIIDAGPLDPRHDGLKMGLSLDNYGKLMGIPKRTPIKFVRDFFLKIKAKFPQSYARS